MEFVGTYDEGNDRVGVQFALLSVQEDLGGGRAGANFCRRGTGVALSWVADRQRTHGLCSVAIPRMIPIPYKSLIFYLKYFTSSSDRPVALFYAILPTSFYSVQQCVFSPSACAFHHRLV
jgi:hypothetical protein